MTLRKIAAIVFFIMALAYLAAYILPTTSTIGSYDNNKYQKLEGIVLYMIPALTFGGYCFYNWTNRGALVKLIGLHLTSAIAFVLISVFWIPNIPPFPRRYLEFDEISLFRPPLQIAVGMLFITMIIFGINVCCTSKFANYWRHDCP